LGIPWSWASFDAGEEEHAIVGREAEDDRGEDEEIGGFDPTLAGVAQRPGQMPTLEDEHEQPERGADRKRVHGQRFDWQDDRPGHQPEDDERGQREDRQAEG
jgi:hypothetical protein